MPREYLVHTDVLEKIGRHAGHEKTHRAVNRICNPHGVSRARYMTTRDEFSEHPARIHRGARERDCGRLSGAWVDAQLQERGGSVHGVWRA